MTCSLVHPSPDGRQVWAPLWSPRENVDQHILLEPRRLLVPRRLSSEQQTPEPVIENGRMLNCRVILRRAPYVWFIPYQVALKPSPRLLLPLLPTRKTWSWAVRRVRPTLAVGAASGECRPT